MAAAWSWGKGMIVSLEAAEQEIGNRQQTRLRILAYLYLEKLVVDQRRSAALSKDVLISATGFNVVIPPMSNRKYQCHCDYAFKAERNLIERFFNNIKHSRGITPALRRAPETFSQTYIDMCDGLA